MGTVITVDVRDPGFSVDVIDAALRWFHRVDETFSTYRADSEIRRLARGEIGIEACSEDVREVLRRCDDMRVRSNGCFDINYGEELDPSGLVKGWSVERAAMMLQAAGARNFFINAGGDVIARGAPEPGRRWRLGIRHPERADSVAAVLAISDIAVATSGLYERGDHIVDPRTHATPRSLVSMTVAGPSITDADAYATAAFVMGEPGAAWVAAIDGYDVLAITADHRVLSSAGMDALRAVD
ncbi:MAG: FAD:protein FMN transferase [Candidatus Dormibacteraeota bacterium]|nr:FAD:protein FMN transferase [Candidatus Dormibacteraeota bacterium]